jgi:hypothetical protein
MPATTKKSWTPFRLVNSDGHVEGLKIYNCFKAANTNGDYNDVVAQLGSYTRNNAKKRALSGTPNVKRTPLNGKVGTARRAVRGPSARIKKFPNFATSSPPMRTS